MIWPFGLFWYLRKYYIFRPFLAKFPQNIQHFLKFQIYEIFWQIFIKNLGFLSYETWQPWGVLNVFDFCQKWYNSIWIIEKLGLLKTIEKLLKDIDIDWNINMKNFNYWTLLKDQYQFFIIVLYCIELYWTQTQMLSVQYTI